MRLWRRRRGRRPVEIAPDEILLDSSNIPKLDTDRFEGRMERPLPRRSLLFVAVFCATLSVVYLGQAWNLQIRDGSAYAARAAENQLSQTILFADRGLILDRTGRVLAGNTQDPGSDFSRRVYADFRGIADVVGYAKPPQKDASGTYYQTASEGMNGVEAAYNSELTGVNGAKLTEESAVGKVVSESTIVPPQNGAPLTLSIDAAVSQGLYDAIAGPIQKSNFQGGAGVIMDIHTGQLLAMVSYPEYSLQVMADGTNTPAISDLLADKHKPFLDRVVDGLYAPGSTVKPFVGTGALTEGVINENTQILSTGSISVPNPYDPAHPSIFKDWRPQGWVDIRHALAVSSDVYFYEVGGGYQGQPGLGIYNIDKYLRLFGFGTTTGLAGFTEVSGTIPSPEWKAVVFPNDPWHLGDTYHTAIGQYGTQVSPLQEVRAVAAIANGGELMTPTILASSTPQATTLTLPEHNLEVVREGMRLGVTGGIEQQINFPFLNIAAKTGTAQVGVSNQYDNSLIIGFWPYENPHYAFAIVLEQAPAPVTVGATVAAQNFFTWLDANEPQYLQ